MQRSRSDGLLQTRRHTVGGHIGGAVPGYMGHVPGMRHEDTTCAATFSRSLEAGRHARSRATFDPQAHRMAQEEGARQARSSAAPPGAPQYDGRGIGYQAAGDTVHSRVPVAGEEKAHLHSSMGLTSLAHENLGGAGRLRGFGSAARGIPGFAGFVPGKVAENVFADGWSKSNERSLGAHLSARAAAPQKRGLMTEGRTSAAPVSSDTLAEVPLYNRSYHDPIRGWSTCELTGTRVAPAGRLAPKDRQEAYGLQGPPLLKAPIHGYQGWVPGRMGESVVGERQCKTNAVSAHLFSKNRVRIIQR